MHPQTELHQRIAADARVGRFPVGVTLRERPDDLPEKRLSVDIKKDFKPKYEIIKGKEKLVDELKERAEKSSGVLLATDPDREGEAISWHLAYILGLNTEDKNRITFNEITKSGISSGM
ncbi:MAG: toprim domain-containing protein, partial [Bilophila wadsworthia]